MIADEVNMNCETVHLILSEELGMRKNCPKMVPRNLKEQQQDAWLSAVFNIQIHYSVAAAPLLT
jgi:GH24 family phage-related lysozyme (muramidase)